MIMQSENSIIKFFYFRLIFSRPKTLIFLLLLVSIFSFFNALKIKVDASSDTLVLDGDKDLELFRETSKRYKSEDFFVIAYTPKNDLFHNKSLLNLAKLVEDLNLVDGVSSIISILDVPLLYSPKLSIADINSDINSLRNPNIDKVIARKELLDSPIYKKLLLSDDSRTTVIQVNLIRDEKYHDLLEKRNNLRLLGLQNNSTKEDKNRLIYIEKKLKSYSTEVAKKYENQVRTIREILVDHKSSAESIYLGGLPMIATDIVDFVKKDLKIFGIGILFFMIFLLKIIFQKLLLVALPIFSCLFTNIVILGILGFFDWRMTVISSNFIAILLIISLAISVHLIVRFQELQNLYPSLNNNDLVYKMASQMLRPCLYTALTTIVAFMSLVVSGIRPVIDFGWMMTLGVVIALITNFIVVPLGLFMGTKPVVFKESSVEHNSPFTMNFANLTKKYGNIILLIFLALLIFSLAGINKLEVENRFIDYFDSSTEIYKGMEIIDNKLGGTVPLEIILKKKNNFISDIDDFDDFDDFDDLSSNDKSNEVSYWFSLAGLNEIGSIHQYLDNLEETGKTSSLFSLYQVTNDLIGGKIDDIQLALTYQGLPSNVKTALVYPYLHEATDEARITVRVKETNQNLNRSELLKLVKRYIESDLGFSEEEYNLTGMFVLYNNMLQSLYTSQIVTLGMVFLAITSMLIILFKSISLALIGITPNLMASFFVLGAMGWAGIPLDMMTITIAAICIGIGVDNTIHYIHRYQKEFLIDEDYMASMFRSHISIGRAMYYTSITIIFGFSILILSNFNPSVYFGFLSGLAMLIALLGSLLLLPRLIILFRPFRKSKNDA